MTQVCFYSIRPPQRPDIASSSSVSNVQTGCITSTSVKRSESRVNNDIKNDDIDDLLADLDEESIFGDF